MTLLAEKQKQAEILELPTGNPILKKLISNSKTELLQAISIRENYSPTHTELQFFATVALRAINTLKAKTYEDFDAHTTSTCCHGIAVFTKEIIERVNIEDLSAIQDSLNYRLINDLPLAGLRIPRSLIELSRLYICTYIKEFNEDQKRTLTKTKRLKLIFPISTNFCNRIAHELQKHFSNLIADRYNQFLTSLDQDMIISDAPVSAWGQYIRPDYLRTDKRGVKYASCLFSMQVTLAYLAATKSIIAIVNDQFDPSENLSDRYISLFQGDGNTFLPLSDSKLDESQPVIIFGGCSNADQTTQDMQLWEDKISSLLLACDTHYPQFPKISDDPEFSTDPITPKEASLQALIQKYKAVPGTSLTDPSLFCLSHIYPTSLYQVLSNQLPVSFLPPSSKASAVANK